MNSRERVALLLRDVRTLPTLPDVAIRLLQLTEGDSTSVKAIANIVERDVTLAARMLKLVNSPLFGIRREVTTVQQALMIVGLAQLRSLVLSSAVMDVFNQEGGVPGFSRKELWGHSVKTAVLAKQIAARCQALDPEVAFTAGLVHDVGKVVLDRYLPKEFAQIVAARSKTGAAMISVENEVLGVNHAQIGEHLAVHWNLPRVLQEAIGYHHDPDVAPQFVRAAGVIAFANDLAHMGLNADESVAARVRAEQLCGLTELQIRDIREAMSENLEAHAAALLT